jgi:hypothetical protein
LRIIVARILTSTDRDERKEDGGAVAVPDRKVTDADANARNALRLGVPQRQPGAPKFSLDNSRVAALNPDDVPIAR